MTISRSDQSPYAGLRHYTESEAPFFFGRSAERDLVIANLLASQLTLVYGESGVGKSSLLHAGVAHTLRQLSESATGDDPRLAVVIFDEWSDPDPIRALVARAAREVGRLVPGLADRPGPEDDLGAALADLSERLGGEVLVVLDQFEESFLYHGEREGPGTIAAELPRALRRDDLGANFLISIREDQLARLDRFKGRIPNLFDNYLRIEHLDRAAAREAIVGPIEELNRLEGPVEDPFGVEPELVEQVLEELEAGKVVVGLRGAGAVEAGAGGRGAPRIETPYLQLVLSRLWEEESRAGSRTLRAETLVRLGGAEAIVRRHLDDSLAMLGADEQAAAARLFYYLVTPSGTKIAHHGADLAAYAGLGEDEAARLLEQLSGEARILRPVGEESYEIYHDVLAPAVLDWRTRAEERRRAEARQARRMRRRRRFLPACVAAIVLTAVAYSFGTLDAVELDTVDARFDVRGGHDIEDVVVVSIDDVTFAELDQRWPFPRSLHARVLDRLREDGVRAVAYDVQFTEPSEPREDTALVEAVGRLRGRIVLATTEVNERGESNVLGGEEFLRELGARSGHASITRDEDGVVRRVAYAVDGLESFGLVAAEIASGRRIGRSERSRAWIDFAGGPGAVPMYSFSQVHQGALPAGVFEDKVVVVGAAAPSLQDVHATSTSGSDFMSGAEIQANIIETALSGFPLETAHDVVNIVLIVVLCLSVPLASLRLSPLPAFGLGVGIGAAYLAASQLAFNVGTIVTVVYPLGLLLLFSVAALGIDVGLGDDQSGSSSIPTASATRLM